MINTLFKYFVVFMLRCLDKLKTFIRNCVLNESPGHGASCHTKTCPLHDSQFLLTKDMPRRFKKQLFIIQAKVACPHNSTLRLICVSFLAALLFYVLQFSSQFRLTIAENIFFHSFYLKLVPHHFLSVEIKLFPRIH